MLTFNRSQSNFLWKKKLSKSQLKAKSRLKRLNWDHKKRRNVPPNTLQPPTEWSQNSSISCSSQRSRPWKDRAKFKGHGKVITLHQVDTFIHPHPKFKFSFFSTPFPQCRRTVIKNTLLTSILSLYFGENISIEIFHPHLQTHSDSVIFGKSWTHNIADAWMKRHDRMEPTIGQISQSHDLQVGQANNSLTTPSQQPWHTLGLFLILLSGSQLGWDKNYVF